MFYILNIRGIQGELLQAAKDVANTLEGDTDQIELDLVSQLQGHARLTAAQKDGQLPEDSAKNLR